MVAVHLEEVCSTGSLSRTDPGSMGSGIISSSSGPMRVLDDESTRMGPEALTPLVYS
jgi:hypothetical protein